MAKDTLTFALDGEIDLREFASAISTFNSLLNQLSREIGKDAKIDWVISELYAGSAIATFRGVYTDTQVVENVVGAYEQVGDALANGREVPFSDTVKRHANALTKVLNGKVTSIRFETPQREYFISTKVEGEKTEPIKFSHGTVRGTIETLTKHKHLSFTLWDSLFNKAINCYVKEGEEENMRNVWGKKAVVSGRVGRNPATGRPVVVRDVRYVRPLEEVEPGSYRKARGTFTWGKGGESPEDIIRRLRDAKQ